MHYTTGTSEAVLHDEIYHVGLRLAEFYEERACIRDVPLLRPDTTDRQGFGSEDFILMSHTTEGKTHDYTNPEYRDEIPTLTFGIYGLRQPLLPVVWSYADVGNMLRTSPRPFTTVGGQGLLRPERVITVPVPRSGGRMIWEEGRDCALAVPEATRLRNLLIQALAEQRNWYGSDASELRHGARATQESMRLTWRATQGLLRATTELVAPPIVEDTAGLFISRVLAQVAYPPHRKHSFSEDDVTSRVGETALQLGIAGPLTVYSSYHYWGYTPQYHEPRHPAVQIFECLNQQGRQQTFSMRQSADSGLMIARVNGPVPMHREDGVSLVGRHLTARECDGLRVLAHGLTA